jgi:hypothetical protein
LPIRRTLVVLIVTLVLAPTVGAVAAPDAGTDGGAKTLPETGSQAPDPPSEKSNDEEEDSLVPDVPPAGPYAYSKGPGPIAWANASTHVDAGHGETTVEADSYVETRMSTGDDALYEELRSIAGAFVGPQVWEWSVVSSTHADHTPTYPTVSDPR